METVKVYVRKGDHDGERILSFHPPKEVAHREWLSRGFAIDGNSVVASVTSDTYVDGAENPEHGELVDDPEESEEEVRTLTQALRDVQSWLAGFLLYLGYSVEFA